jgi:hypothetical protein
MSACSPYIVGGSKCPPNQETPFNATKTSSSSDSDWLATLLLTAKAISAGVDCIPFPYVNGLFRMVVILLETVEVSM